MSSAKGRRGKKPAVAVVPLTAGQAGERAWHLVGVLAGGVDPRGFEHTVPGVPASGADPLLERIVVAEQLISWARSQQLADIAGLSDVRTPVMAPDELSALDRAELDVGALLVLSRRQASQRVDEATDLRELPQVMALLRSGLIDLARAQAISRAMNEHLQPSGDPAADKARWYQVEKKVTARAPSRTAAMLRSDVARAALRVDPDAAERRRVKRREDREVRMYPRADGMANVEALLDAESAAIIDNTLTLLADAARDAGARAGMPDERTHAQRRADALTGIFRAVADGRQLRLHVLPRRPADPGPSDGFGEDSQYIPACFVRPTHDADDYDDGCEGGGTVHQQQQEPGTTTRSAASASAPAAAAAAAVVPEPAAVPAWWEPPHIPRQQRRRPHLVVTIHADTLAGWDDLPGELAGYGAITAQAARDLARQCGSADLVILDPAPGSSPDCTPACRPTDPDPPTELLERPRPVSYKPRDQVIRDVMARNRTCRAPGCTRPAGQCDLDHVIPFSREKRSCPCNLIPLCRRHHRLKTLGGWKLALVAPAPGEAAGAAQWTSPTGRRYAVPPPDQPGTPGW